MPGYIAHFIAWSLQRVLAGTLLRKSVEASCYIIRRHTFRSNISSRSFGHSAHTIEPECREHMHVETLSPATAIPGPHSLRRVVLSALMARKQVPSAPQQEYHSSQRDRHGPVDPEAMRYHRATPWRLPIKQWHCEERLETTAVSFGMISCDERWRLTATNVPGRNVMVNSAMAFIAELSLFAADAISRESAAIDWLAMLSRWAIRFHI